MLAAAPARAVEAPPPLLDEKGVCLAKHRESQIARQAGRLIAAHESLLVCSRETCPTEIRTDCGGWLQDVAQLTPSIILSARTTQGDESAVHVTMDGQLFTGRLDGKAVDVDPGEHVFRFELAPHDPVEQKVIVRESEKGRIISVQLGKKDAPALPVEPARVTAPMPPTVEESTGRTSFRELWG